MRIRRRLLFAWCLCAGAAHAEPSAQAAAEALFLAGRASMQAGDYAVACERFHESDRLEQGIGTRLNLGLCEEKLGHWASAWDYYQRVLQSAPAGDPRARLAREAFAALDPRLPRVTVRLAAGAPASTTVSHDAVTYERASFGVALPMDVGEQRFSVRADGFAAREYVVRLEEGQRAELVVEPAAPLLPAAPVELVPLGPRAQSTRPATSVPPPVDRQAPRGADSTAALGVGLMIGGGAALAVAGVTGLMLVHDRSVVENGCDAAKTCDSQRELDAAAQGRVLNVVTPVALASGVLLAGTGLYLILNSGSRRGQTRLGASISHQSAALVVVHPF